MSLIAMNLILALSLAVMCGLAGKLSVEGEVADVIALMFVSALAGYIAGVMP
jgi:hypothetical protein